MRIGPKATTAKAIGAAVMLAAVPMQATADAAMTYFERTVVLEADARCRMFSGPVRSALTTAQRQARNAALRAGAKEVDLNDAASRARVRAAGVACGEPDLKLIEGRVENAFSGWVRMPRMTFPGARADWMADRTIYKSARWRLVQASMTGSSPVAFGYATSLSGEALTAVVSFRGQARPYAARLVLRDPQRAPRAWLGQAGSLPPEGLQKVIWASGSAPAEAGVLFEGRTTGEMWRFPEAAAAALERLDPREPFAVEFVFRDDSIARATFEAGDFAAGRAFLMMGAM